MLSLHMAQITDRTFIRQCILVFERDDLPSHQSPRNENQSQSTSLYIALCTFALRREHRSISELIEHEQG
jgi:hypothetical protein